MSRKWPHPSQGRHQGAEPGERRERDSNPRYLAVHTISNRAPSAARASLPSLPGHRKPAEREGFEPPVELPPHLISNQAPSTSRPPLQPCSNCQPSGLPPERL